jgi:hypothetical protein
MMIDETRSMDRSQFILNTARILTGVTMICLLAVVPGQQLQASTFNTAGWGLPLAPLATMNPGAGGSGFATCDTNLVNFFNPAGNAGSRRTRFYQLLDLHNEGAWDGQESDWSSRLNFSGTAWYIPLKEMGIGVQLQKITDAVFFTHERGIDPTFADTSDSGASGEYYTSLHRSGGLYRAGLSLSWRVDPRLFVGMGIDFIGGSVSSIWTLNYAQSAPPFDSQVISEQELDGWQTRFGVVGKPWPWLQCGLSWAPAVTLQNRNRISNYSTESNYSVTSGDAHYPSELTAGLQLINQLSRYKADLLWRNNERDTSDDYQLVVACGYTHQGVNLRSNRWWRRLTYHTGLSWQEIDRDWLPAPVQETTFSAGIGWQPLGSSNSFDTGVQVFNRGNLDDHGRQEIGVRVFLAVAIKEQWFQRRVERGLP